MGQAIGTTTNGGRTKLDITSWVSIRVVIAVLSVMVTFGAAIWGATARITGSVKSLQGEVTSLRRDMAGTVYVMLNMMEGTGDRHTASAERAIWKAVDAANPDFIVPDIERIQRENPPPTIKRPWMPLLDSEQ